MKKADWKLIGYIGTALGIIFLIGAIFSYFYFEVHETTLGGAWVTYPLQEYVGNFLLLGIILLVIGLGCYGEQKWNTDYTLKGFIF